MTSLNKGYIYDIFISRRRRDNKFILKNPLINQKVGY
jgi:hypothetical protein